MNEHDQLREQMWDLVYGLATPAENAVLRARITSDPKIARLYAEVRLEADLIAQAAKVDDASVTLPVIEPRREKPAAAKAKTAAEPARAVRLSQSLHWLAAVAASALAVVLTIGTFWRTEPAPRGQEDFFFISVWQSDALVASVPTELQLEAKDAEGKPAAAKLRAQVADSRGRTLYETVVETDEEGKASFHVPGQAVAQDVNLRVLRDVVAKLEAPTQTTPSPAPPQEAEQIVQLQKREQIVLDELLPVQPEPIQAGATFDKDWYVPGEEVQFRAAPVTAFSRQPQDPSTLAFRLHGPDGRQWAPAEAATVEAAGVVSGKFQLPADAPPGQYALTVLGRAPVLLGDEAEVIVASESAQLKESLFAREALDGTARLKRSLESVSGFGVGGFGEAVRDGTPAGPAPGGGGGKVDESRENRRDLAMNQAASRSAKGRATAGTAGARSDPAPSGEPAAAASAAPTAPALEGADPLPNADKLAQVDRPADSQRFFGQLEKAMDGSPPVKALQVVVPPEFAGKPVEIEAFYKSNIRLGKTVAEANQGAANEKFAELASNGLRPRTAAVPLAQWVDGEEVEVEFKELSPTSPPLRIRKLVKVPSALEIELGEAKETYAPGETVRMVVEVKNKLNGSAVPNAAFCLAVKPALVELTDLQQLSKAIDDRVSLLDEKQAQGLRSRSATRSEGVDRAADLLAKPMSKLAAKDDAKKSEAGKDQAGAADAPTADGPPLPAPASAPDAAARESAPAPADLPLVGGTFMDADGGAMHYDNANDAVDSFAQTAPPVLISNEATVKKVLEDAEAERSAQQVRWALWRARLGRLLLVGGVVMLLALGVAFAMQRPAKALVWIPSLAIAAASFAVGVVWLLNQPHPPGREMARALRDDASGSISVPDNDDWLRNPATATPPESRAAVVTDSESVLTGQTPRAGSPAASEFEAASADGTEPGIAGDLRQRRAIDRQDAQQPVEELDLAQRGGERPGLESAGRMARDKRPAALGNAPAEPEAAKKDTPATAPVKESGAGVKAKQNAGDDVTTAKRQPQRKGAVESEHLERLSGKGERAEADKKKMGELTKNGAVGGRGAAENKLADSSESLQEKDGRKKAAGNVWQPVLLADENGRLVIEFTMPEAPGEYRLELDVNGQGRFGRLQTTLRCEPQLAAPPAAAAPATPAAKP